jgi:hypothetical protein
MPDGTGKTKRVAVFAQGAKAEEAKAAGADIVGLDDLAEQIKAGNMDFDVVIATPDAMRVVGRARPDPRPARPDAEPQGRHRDARRRRRRCKNAKAGQVQYRVDKAGIVHCTHRPCVPSTAAAAQGNLRRPDRRAEQGQAGRQRRACTCASVTRVLDHGSWACGWITASLVRSRLSDGPAPGTAAADCCSGERSELPAGAGGHPRPLRAARHRHRCGCDAILRSHDASADGDPAVSETAVF